MGFYDAFGYFLEGIDCLGLLIECLKNGAEFALAEILAQDKVVDGDIPVGKDIFQVGASAHWTVGSGRPLLPGISQCVVAIRTRLKPGVGLGTGAIRD